jgi:hypothetical protein
MPRPLKAAVVTGDGCPISRVFCEKWDSRRRPRGILILAKDYRRK